MCLMVHFSMMLFHCFFLCARLPRPACCNRMQTMFSKNKPKDYETMEPLYRTDLNVVFGWFQNPCFTLRSGEDSHNMFAGPAANPRASRN